MGYSFYAIDYRNMHTAIHGLLIFTDESEALGALTNLTSISTALMDSELDYSIELEGILEKVYDSVEEIDFRKDLKYDENSIKYYDYHEGACRILNSISVDLYL